MVNPDVPSARERQGDFSECDPASPNFNDTVVGRWTVRCTRQSQHERSVSERYRPSRPDRLGASDRPDSAAQRRALLRYRTAPSLPTYIHEDMFKIDHNFSDKIRAFVRYTQDTDNQDFIPTLWSPANYGR